jgi:hypothetical protein
MDAETINVAENTDLMTNPKKYERNAREGIWKRSLTSGQLSTSAWSTPTAPRFRELTPLILRSGASRVSKNAGPAGASWFETHEDALLTMRAQSCDAKEVTRPC